jgi:Effector protein/RTX calcium-binding nonapeptide repeat (4 copies)
VATDIDHDTLAPRLEPLRVALDAFRSSAGWPEFLSDVPPLDIDFAAVRGKLGQEASFVDQVASGFDAAGAGADPDGVITTPDESLAPHVSIDLVGPVTLVQEGARWIFSGSGDRDFVRVVTLGGTTFLEVGLVEVGDDGRRRLRWESRELTGEQAANLVIRTGGGEDFVGISPDVAVRVTVWTGEGNDAVGMPGQSYSSRLGGGGDDLIFTGGGDDRVEGGAGDDDLFGGRGYDEVQGSDGTDKVTAETQDLVIDGETYVTIELTGDPGSYAIDLDTKPEWMTDAEWAVWRERIDADIEFLRTTHTGRPSLTALDQAARGEDFNADDQTIRILPYTVPTYDGPRVASFDEYAEALLNHENLPRAERNPVDTLTWRTGSYHDDAYVGYGHTDTTDFGFGQPSLYLHHELSHGFDGLHGGISPSEEVSPSVGYFYTEVLRDRNGNEIERIDVTRWELNSVGFDLDGSGDPDTVEAADGTVHPDYFTENALRQELRRPWRDSYALGSMGTQDRRREGEYVTYENTD